MRFTNVTKAKEEKKWAPAHVNGYPAASLDKMLQYDCGNFGPPDDEWRSVPWLLVTSMFTLSYLAVNVGPSIN